ncbi:MAG TPA: L-2-hydroxyglutarate oxidase [Gemmatimonadaceae bacterium]|nr:L-2-hydroxyglutarate oxidase [Gemmatimonadaceae bacterium]
MGKSGTDVLVVGGGIVALASTYRLLERSPGLRVVVLEKEPNVGMHQSTHNSGVLHAGLHYAPGSLRATLVREGIRSMVEFCQRHGIAHEQCGKLVTATSEDEVARLRTLQERGTRNGLRGLRWLTPAEMQELEPHVTGVAGLHVPEEGIVDYRAVCDRLRDEIESRGGTVRTGAQVRALRREAGGWIAESAAGAFAGRLLVNCAGLHADRVARMAGERPRSRIVPFRGEYWTLRPERAHLVRNLIYPVPDPRFPFLGVHFTRMIHGGIEAGPNAVLAFAREGYRWSRFNARDFTQSVAFAGLWRFVRRYPRVATYEVARSLSRSIFARSLQKLVPEVETRDLERGTTGVRAQAMTPDGELIQDFDIVQRPGAVHVINAPSPAATASLAIGRHISELVVAAL